MKITNYISITDPDIKVTATQVKNDTVVQSEYGDILVTAGNYVVEVIEGFNVGRKFGITQTDLDISYIKEL